MVLAMALGLWATLVVLFAIQFVLVGSFGWGEAFIHAASFWLTWVLFMPAVVWLSFRFPIERRRLLLNLSVHVLACVMVATLSQFALRNIIHLPPPPPGEGPRPNEEQRQSVARRVHRPNGFTGLRAGLDILIYWSLMSVCQAITNFRQSQQRERRAAELEARLTRSKLQSLRMQINPHFLFNTLNAISTLIYVNPRAADEMIGDLSDLLRRSLDSGDEQEIPLGQELGFIRNYVSIEQKRFGDRLRVEEQAPADLLPALVPALILQPLVENAIRHGIEPQRTPGVIMIEARRDGNSLILSVRDNGRGLEPNAGGQPAHRGIGLTNTRARLQELYGPAHHFSFRQGSPRGCVVELRLPYHTAPAAAAEPAPIA